MDWKSLEGLKFRGGHGDTEYRLGARRGSGGFGSVFEATRSQSGQPDARVAIKVFEVEETDADGNRVLDHGAITRKLNELVTQVAERHESIVATPRHGIGSVDLRGRHGVFMEMELAEHDLLKRMSSGRMSVDEVRKLVVDICRGLAFLHDRANPIVHRDLKPGNILWFAGQRRWKLGDLGLARELSQPGQLTRTAQIGTPIYMSPEAFKGEVGPASDMWALGVIIAELLTGRVPFGHGVSEVYQVMYQILEGRPDFGSTLPSPFDRIVDDCLSKEWKKRVSAGQVLELLGERSGAGHANSGAVINRNPPPPPPRYTPGQIIAATLRDGSAAPELCAIPPGGFDMGDLGGKEHGYAWRLVVPGIKVSYWFGLGRFAVTFEEYERYVAAKKGAVARPKDEGWGRGRLPVINVSWGEAQGYIAWLNEQCNFAANNPHRWRLPTEAEWEYACRAGSQTEFWWGNDISSAQANYGGFESKGAMRTVAVEGFQPNPWGLFQMHGNVYEYCEDVYDQTSYKAHPERYPNAIRLQDIIRDGPGFLGDDEFIVVRRGGCWRSRPTELRSGNRSNFFNSHGNNDLGFRLARTLP